MRSDVDAGVVVRVFRDVAERLVTQLRSWTAAANGSISTAYAHSPPYAFTAA